MTRLIRAIKNRFIEWQIDRDIKRVIKANRIVSLKPTDAARRIC